MFKAEIKIKGINPYVLVSAARAARIKAGWKKPMPVLVQMNGQPEPAWRINKMPVTEPSISISALTSVRPLAGSVSFPSVRPRLLLD